MAIVGSLCLAWGKTATEELHLLFREVFRDEGVEEADVRQAARVLLQDAREFMPTPGQLLQAALEIQADRDRAESEKRRDAEYAERHQNRMEQLGEQADRLEKALPGAVEPAPAEPKRVLIPLTEDQWAERREKLLQQAKEILEPPK